MVPPPWERCSEAAAVQRRQQRAHGSGFAGPVQGVHNHRGVELSRMGSAIRDAVPARQRGRTNRGSRRG